MTSRSEIQLGAPAPTAAIVALVALIAAILTTVVRSRPLEPTAPPPAVSIRVAAAVEPEPSATALVDAVPWGRIERIESAAGEQLELPPTRETPVLLELPAGVWRVALSNPSFDEERECEFALTDGARDDCLVEFERLSVDRYFRETGWWR